MHNSCSEDETPVVFLVLWVSPGIDFTVFFACLVLLTTPAVDVRVSLLVLWDSRASISHSCLLSIWNIARPILVTLGMTTTVKLDLQSNEKLVNLCHEAKGKTYEACIIYSCSHFLPALHVMRLFLEQSLPFACVSDWKER